MCVQLASGTCIFHPTDNIRSMYLEKRDVYGAPHHGPTVVFLFVFIFLCVLNRLFPFFVKERSHRDRGDDCPTSLLCAWEHKSPRADRRW